MQVIGQTQINQALTAGSDATGAGATALQAASAAAAASTSGPVTVPPLTTGSSTTPAVSTPSALSATSALAASAAADSAGLASDGSSHTHSDGGDPGSGLGASGGDGAAALQQLGAANAPSSTDSAPAPTTLHVQAPVDSSDFPQGVADRVSFAVDNNWNSAKLQVNPAQLGPVDLQIAVQGDRAQVVMSTHSAVTREALEASVPKLKEMLNSQGFTQVSVDISQRSFQDRSAFSQPYTWAQSSAASPAVAAAASQAVSGASARVSSGVVDAYA